MAQDNKKQIPDDLAISMVMNDPTEADRKKALEPYLLNVDSYACYDADVKMSLAVIFAGSVESVKGYCYKFSKYPFYRLIYTVSGEAILNQRSQQYRLTGGTLYGLPPNAPGEIEVVSAVPRVHYYLHFTGTKAEKFFNMAGFAKEKVIPVSDSVEVQQIFKNIIEEMKTKTKSFHTIISNYLEILLLKLADKTLYCKEHLSVSHSTYLQCRDYINRNFSKIITIQTVADQCNVDKGYVCRLFRKYTHTTPMSYVIKLKMDKAVMLLTQTDISIKKIGYMLNFENQYYFSRIFKKIYGVSPKFYRQQH